MATKKTSPPPKLSKKVLRASKNKKAAAKTVKKPQIKKNVFTSLNKLNIGLAVLLAVQAITILILGNNSSAPLTSNYLTKDALASQVAGHTVTASATRNLFDIRLAYLVVATLLIAAIVHILVATRYRKTYESNLRKDLNKAQ